MYIYASRARWRFNDDFIVPNAYSKFILFGKMRNDSTMPATKSVIHIMVSLYDHDRAIRYMN